jgi:hypothetical protein
MQIRLGLHAVQTEGHAVSCCRPLKRRETRGGATQNNLGAALQTPGARESGTARFNEAVTAYRDALLEGTRDRVPLQWAATQNNLGNALRLFEERRHHRMKRNRLLAS